MNKEEIDERRIRFAVERIFLVKCILDLQKLNQEKADIDQEQRN